MSDEREVADPEYGPQRPRWRIVKADGSFLRYGGEGERTPGCVWAPGDVVEYASREEAERVMAYVANDYAIAVDHVEATTN